MRAAIGAVLAVLVGVAGGSAPSVRAYADEIDFAAYPRAATDDYLLGNQWVGYGFRTVDGFVCTLSMHMSMSAVDCHGPFVGAPDGADTVHLFAYSAGSTATPVYVYTSDADAWADPSSFEGYPLAVLAEDVTFAATNSVCAHTAAVLLACWIGDRDIGNGFVATAASTKAVGR